MLTKSNGTTVAPQRSAAEGISNRVVSVSQLQERSVYTLSMWVDRFRNSWVGSRQSIHELLAQFIHYYNCQRRTRHSMDARQLRRC